MPKPAKPTRSGIVMRIGILDGIIREARNETWRTAREIESFQQQFHLATKELIDWELRKFRKEQAARDKRIERYRAEHNTQTSTTP